MNFTDLFIRRPVFATVLSLIILLVGFKSYFSLPVRLYPKVDATAVNVTVTYAGADASLMEGFVTTPIENAIAGVDGIDYMLSQSQAGKTTITIYFTLGYDINVAVSDVNSKVSSVRSKLPNEIDDPVVSKSDPNAQPSMYINFSSDTLKSEQITDYLERVIQPQIQTLPGISQAQIYGSEYAMRIWLNPNLMASRNITTQDIKEALLTKNAQTPSGPIKSSLQQLNVKNNTDLNTQEQFDNIVLRQSDNSLIRIKDIGRAELGAKTTDTSAFSQTLNEGIKPIITLAITPGPTANPVDVSKEVKALLPKLERTMPKGLSFRLVWDNSIYIEQSIEEVKKTIIEATICVIVVVFMFLGAWRILLIPVVTIPLSLVGVCTVMLALGYTINTITLLAMVLAIGMVVDDAIVVAENIHRHMAEGKTPFQAAIAGAREIQFAVIAMTFTLAAVYAPIGFSSGLTGSLFKEFAFTLAASVVISGFIALTLSPMMCSKFMNPDVLNGKTSLFIHHTFEKIMHAYRRLLTRVIEFRKIVVIIIVIFFSCIAFLWKIIPADIAPREDVGGIFFAITAPTSANFKYTEKYTSYILPILKNYPELDSALIVNGSGSGGTSSNSAIGFMILKLWDQRSRSAFAIAQDLFPKLWSIPGLTVYPAIPNMLPGATGTMPISLVIQTTGSYEDLYEVMKKMILAAKSNPGLTSVDTDLKLDQPQIDIHIDRDRAGDLGIDIKDIGDAVNIALGEPRENRFSLMGRAYDVVPELLPEYRVKPSDTLNLMYMRTQGGELVPLSNVVSLQETLQPQSLNHFQQIRSATLTANMAPGYSLGQAIDYLQGMTDEIVPKEMKLDYGGQSRQYIQEGSMMSTIVFAIIFIFLVLAAQFESFRDPWIVLLGSVPPAIFGALLVLFFTMRVPSIRSTINIYSEIGFVTLIGLISKHGILMVEFANQLQEQGRSIKEAIIEAASIRLRPVLMTTGAMILGAIPLALATGAGSISRSQMGLVIVGGMTIGTIFTLFVVPTVYTMIASKKSPILDEGKKLDENK